MTLPLSLSVVVIFLSIQASVIYLLYSPDIHLPAECFVPSRRPELRSVEEVSCEIAKRIVVIDGVVDTTNIGAIFRSAAALGIDAVLLTRNSCDPLNRRAVRVSMGSIFLVSWTWIDGSLSRLGDLGFRTAAMALTDDSISIDDPVLKTEPKLAIIMGTEGDGLPYETISEADYVVRIPMSHSVDSLNVAAAASVAFGNFVLQLSRSDMPKSYLQLSGSFQIKEKHFPMA